ncbi:MAG: BTAD domain-containing putative transcriptional regulator [Caldimonas sp.]
MASLLTPAAADATASPYWVGVWWWRVGSVHAKFGDADAARSCRDRAWQIARDAGVVELDYALLGEDLNGYINSGALLAAGEAAARMRALAPAVNAAWQGHGLVYTARLHLMRVEPAAAVQLCRAALELYAGCELSEREQDVGRSTLAYALLLLGDADGCLRMLEGCRPNQTGGQRAMLETQILALRAWLALRTGSAEFDELLRNALRGAAAIHAHHVLYFLPQQAAALFEAALAREIEVEFVTHAIRIRRLAPPDPADARWPWRLRIRVLGGFSIERDGVLLGVARKAQKKPEELLKAIVAAGGDAEVDQLIDELWPDQEAKDPRASFDMAVSRLRKILGVEAALVLADGRLAFDRRVVWCDAQAFETLRLRLHDALSRMSEVEAVVSLTEQLVTLYKGPLFGAGAVALWMLAPRERLAMAWQRAVQDAGAWLESRSQWRTAIVLYERAVAHQMLAEPVYRGLMRCHFAVGERAEGLIVYRRCRDLLSRVLGIEPSTETSRLHQRLLSDAERRDGT